MKFYTIDCDWEKLLLECQKVYKLWEEFIKPQSPEGYDMTLSKNSYNLVTLSTPLPEFYNLWRQVYGNIRKEFVGNPLYIHAWLNVHRSEDLNKKSLGWHSHAYCKYHGFVHLSNKETETLFTKYEPTIDERNLWNDDPTKAVVLDTHPTRLSVKNKQGLQYIGPGDIMHKVVPKDYSGIRASIGYDIIDSPTERHFYQDILVPIL